LPVAATMGVVTDAEKSDPVHLYIHVHDDGTIVVYSISTRGFLQRSAVLR
jgi:hypothetical protein